MEDLKSEIPNWSLQSDQRLLSVLKTFSDNLLYQIQEASASIDTLSKDTTQLEVKVGNAINRFQLLSHSQYIEKVPL